MVSEWLFVSLCVDRYLLATGSTLVDRLAPWSKLVGDEQVLHLISALTENALAHLIEEVHEELRPILQRTLVLNPSYRWNIDRLMVRPSRGCFFFLLGAGSYHHHFHHSLKLVLYN